MVYQSQEDQEAAALNTLPEPDGPRSSAMPDKETTKRQPEAIHIPAEIQQQAQDLVKGAFDTLSDHLQQLNSDLGDFSRKRQEVRERIQSGPRRTSGRIV